METAMYDPLTTSYRFACPVRGTARVRLSAFRSLERLAGPEHPSVYRVRFDCPCGEEHDALVAHDDLDWAPLGVGGGLFVNLMTDKTEPVESELLELAARRIEGGDWPWSFFCYAEDVPRPIFPSSFVVLAPGASRDLLALAVGCPSCGGTSINLVSTAHVDLPFHHDREVGVVPHLFEADTLRVVDEFRAELYSESFDLRRLHLD
ncbi:MAG TPA: hypothetical protein VNB86_04645 [Gaiellaceae bacterium]|jgi:hypothetical protein|nr:hypothetical protein [Gaiellaceae bacterium]